MLTCFRAALLATALCVSASAAAEHLFVHVPIGQQGTLTAPSFVQIDQTIRAIPGGADAVPATAYKNGYAVSMKDMLQTTPGVFAQPRWGEESRLSIRGSGLSRGFHLRGITILQDGIPFNFADGASDFQELDPLTLRHVEVYRGGNGLRYGAATLGGAVNAVTQTAHDLDYLGLMRMEGGSFHTQRLHAEAGKVFDDTDAYVSYTKAMSEGYREHNENNNIRLNANIGAKLGNDAETRFYVSYNRLNQNIPGTISKNAAEHRPESAALNNIIDQHARDINSLRLANRTVFDLGAGRILEVGGYMNNKDLYHPIFQVVDQQSIDLGLFARLKGERYVVGINTGRGRNDAKRFINDGGSRGNTTAEGKQIARNVEIYGEYRLPVLNNVDVVLGGQGSFSFRDYTDHRNAANNADKTFRNFNPKLGVLWQAAPDREVYASITRASEVPTFSELVQGAVPGFVPIDAQKSWTAEIGTRGEQGRWNWDATFYHARMRDEMLQFTVGGGIPAATFNADKTIHQGVELGFGYAIDQNWSVQVIYNWNDFRFDGDAHYGDNDLAGAPEHQIRVSLPYENGAWMVEPSIEIVPQGGWIDYANTLRADPYAVVNMKASYEISKSAEIFFDARNITDETYAPSYSTVTDGRTANTDVFYPGDGRSAYVGLQIKF